MFFAKLVPFEWRSRRIGVFIFVLVALFRGWWLKRRLALTAIKKLPPSTERHQRARGSRQEPRQQQLQSAAENRQQRQQHSQLNERALASQQTVGRRQPHQSIASKPDLWCAVEAGNACSAWDLIKAGHDVNASYKGWTPLMKAAEEGHCEIITGLLERKAAIEASNKHNRTALSFAAAPSMGRQACVQAVKLILEARANVSHADSRGETARDRARRDNYTESVDTIDRFLADGSS